MDPQKFGAFIQTTRKELGMTQEVLAAHLQVTAKAVSRWERGVGFPDIQLLEPLAEALGITLIELMQSEKLEEPVPASLVSNVVQSIRQQEELSRKQKTDLVRGTLIIGAAASFLFCLGQFYEFEPRWVGGLLRLIALVGGVWGWRTFRSIVTESYLREQNEGIWFTWKPWAAWGVSIAGLALLTCMKDFISRESWLYSLLVIVGFVLLIPGGYYLYRYILEGE